MKQTFTIQVQTKVRGRTVVREVEVEATYITKKDAVARKYNIVCARPRYDNYHDLIIYKDAEGAYFFTLSFRREK